MILGPALVILAVTAQTADLDDRWQRLSRISPGHDADVYLSTSPMLRGRLANFSAQGFTVTDGFNSIAVDRLTVRKVTRKSRVHGALFGLAIGVGLGAVAGITAAAIYDRHRGAAFATSTLGAGFWGAVIGGTIGRQATLYKGP